MWYFLGVRLFKGELLAVKVNSNFKEKNARLGGVKKNNTRSILIFRTQKVNRFSTTWWLTID